VKSVQKAAAVNSSGTVPRCDEKNKFVHDNGLGDGTAGRSTWGPATKRMEKGGGEEVHVHTYT
jgi:hypothetical protein